MIINSNIKDKLPFNNLNDVYVVADFDRTLTNPYKKTSWSIMDIGDYYPDSYLIEAQELFDYYRPIEMSEEISLEEKIPQVEEWFKKRVELFVKYSITKKMFDDAVKIIELIEFRPGVKEFIEFLHNNNVPFIILSAGVGNLIESFLEYNNCNYDNVYICANKIIFKDGLSVGVEKKIIHSYNKNEVSLTPEIKEKIKDRNNAVLLGDQVGDLDMVDKKNHDFVATIGFTTLDSSRELLSSYYDIVCEDSDNYFDIKELLFNSN